MCATGPPNDVSPRRSAAPKTSGALPPPGRAQSRVAPGFQSGSSGPRERVRRAGEDEEKVGEPVQVDGDERSELVVPGGSECLALGAPADRPGDVQAGGGHARPTGQHEAPELR